MKNILLLIAFIAMTSMMSAQQIANTSLFTETQAFWNPATTAYGENLIINTFLRKQWVSFKGTPATGYFDYQYPFVDHNMSVGGTISFDKIGPFTKIDAQAKYAYKLQEIGGDYGQLSFGLSAGVQSYSFNSGNEEFNDEGDPLITDLSSGFAPIVGLGVFYISNNRMWKGNSFYTGFAMNQIMQSDIIKDGKNQKRTRHIVANLGGKFYIYDTYFEPSININYTTPDIIDLQVGLKYEVRDVFWTGLGYSSAKELGIQGGVILDGINGRFSRLKIGALANLAITQRIKQFGPSFELLVNYEFEM